MAAERREAEKGEHAPAGDGPTPPEGMLRGGRQSEATGAVWQQEREAARYAEFAKRHPVLAQFIMWSTGVAFIALTLLLALAPGIIEAFGPSPP